MKPEKHTATPQDPIIRKALDYEKADPRDRPQIYLNMLKEIFERFPGVKEEVLNANSGAALRQRADGSWPDKDNPQEGGHLGNVAGERTDTEGCSNPEEELQQRREGDEGEAST